MALCSTCGAPDHLRCNCATTPYCNQCDENDNCDAEVDSLCVVYHPTYPNQTPPVSKLTCLGLPNGSSAQTIFEALDTKLCQVGNQPITPVVSQSVLLTVSGSNNRSLRADVIVSPDAGNLLTIHTNGVFVTNPNPNYLVKVDPSGSPDYLFNQITGDTSGCIAIDILDDNGQVVISPSLNLDCFATQLCAAGTGTKNTIASCLLASGLQANDTQTINLTLTPTNPTVLTADVIISPDAGNALSAHSNGLFSSGGVSTVNNALTNNAGTVQLGGPLVQNTTIGFNSGAQYLRFNSTPQIVVGEGTPSGGSLIEVQNTYPSGFNYNAGISAVTTTTLRSGGGAAGAYGIVSITGGTDTDASVKAGTYGEIFFSGSASLNTVSPEAMYCGTHGITVLTGTGTTVTGTHMVGGVVGGAFAADNGTLTNFAALMGRGLYQSPAGASYTGIITNYYGLYIEDIVSAGLNPRITNKFGAFIAGSHGSGYNVAETAFATTSDQRIKENIKNLTYGLPEIEQLRPVTYNMIESPTVSQVGFIAQEVETIFPEAVGKVALKGYDDLRVLDKDVIFTALVNAVKELSAKVKALESK